METLELRVVPTIAPALSWTIGQDFGNGAVMLRTRSDAAPPSNELPPVEEGGSLRPPMNLNGNGLQFNLIPALGMSAQAIAGFQAAANLWSAILRDDIMVNIEIDFTALGSGILGQAGSTTQGNAFTDVKTALANDAKSLTDQSAVLALPAASSLSLYTSDATTGNPEIDNNGSGNNTTLDVNTANAKAIGLRSANNSTVDGDITFSSNFTWDFDRSNGITSGAFDFVGVSAGDPLSLIHI